MKQLLILSGKGGTGKTTVASALIELAYSRAFAGIPPPAPRPMFPLPGSLPRPPLRSASAARHFFRANQLFRKLMRCSGQTPY